MLINEVYEAEDVIPKDLRENYEQLEDGTFKLKLVRSLKSALDKERDAAKSAKDALKSAEEATQEQIQSAVQAREAELRTEFSQTESDAVKAARDEASKAKRDASAIHALQKAGGNISLLQDKVASQLELDEKGNPIVVDADGTPLLNDEGSAMTVDGLIASMKANPEYAGAFKGTGSTGGGAPPTDGAGASLNGGGRTEAPSRRSQMSPQEKVAYIKANGNDAFQDLPL